MCTAFILYSHSLFAHGLEHLLRREGAVTVIGVEKAGREALARIRPLNPDVIIVEGKRTGFETERLLSRYFREQPKTRIVCLNLHDNTAVLYSGSRCVANSVGALIQSVLSSLMTER